MSQKSQGNKQSEKGESHAHSGSGGKSVKGDMCGSSGKEGIRFPVPDHHGIHESNNPKTP